MSKSNMVKDIAEILNIELNEPFNIKEVGNNPYTLKESGLYNKYNSCVISYLYGLLTGEYEIDKSILCKEEKEYLESVLRPFKDRVEYIAKRMNENGQWLHFDMKYEQFSLPLFEKDTMYKSMELNKYYTLKELGLFNIE